jgi:UDP-glucose 4-epimerase
VPYREEAPRPGDPAAVIADASRARDLLGWTARRSELGEIVASAGACYRLAGNGRAAAHS